MNLHEFVVNLGASDNLLLVGSYADCDNYTRALKEREANAEIYSVNWVLRKTVFLMLVQSEERVGVDGEGQMR